MSGRNLIIILGDQLSLDQASLKSGDPEQDVVWMAEVQEESTHVWTHKARIALFLSAMRHFRDDLRDAGWTVDYQELSDKPQSLSSALEEAVKKHQPEKLIMTEAGEYRVEHSLKTQAGKLGLDLEILEDDHFLISRAAFKEYAEGRKSLRMEFFYRDMRKKYDVLMDGGKPKGGDWNYDSENRKAFPKNGPPLATDRASRELDKITTGVIELIEKHFPDHPGKLDSFSWPVNRRQALEALDRFISDQLPVFGQYQDAMWKEEPFLYHSLLASSLNLKLLHPLEVVEAAEKAYRDGRRNISLASVEGFIRQILGWREYVRGIYWTYMPDYINRNTLNAEHDLPGFYWTGDTDMTCMKDAIGTTLKHGYAHHIQRLMVTGLYSLLFGVDPKQVHEWYLAVYVDAVEWVELPNTLGMSQFADDGVMASKPYAASGKYIDRMSNYCKSCRYDPGKKTGEDACPFTTLYWDFLLRHEDRLKDNARMKFQLKNLDRLDGEQRKEIQSQAAKHRKAVAVVSAATIVWFRQDLRLTDHPPLQAALRRGEPIIPVYIWSPEEEGDWAPGGASKFWIHQALKELDQDLQTIGSRLILRSGKALDVLDDLIQETNADAVYWTRRYEPDIIDRDTSVKTALKEKDIQVTTYNGSLLFEPWEVSTKSDTPYKVFTPFYKQCMTQLEDKLPFEKPDKLPRPGSWPESENLDVWKLEPDIPWAEGIKEAWTFGESGALEQLDHFIDEGLADYKEGRDRPDKAYVSRLSPHLHFGHISPRYAKMKVEEAMQDGRRSGVVKAGEHYIRELFWREFSYHLLYYFPQTTSKPLKDNFNDFRWSQSKKSLKAWQKGQTGYPIVDAGMRQLWKTGWMHNRVRMIVASFLTKDLFIHWKEGADWFWDTLVDADLANNTSGWQWTAGSGADAAPYFRVFNPIGQGKKFDPEGDYVRTYVPELRDLPKQCIHSPWEAPTELLEKHGVKLGENYPEPIVDHSEMRKEALARYDEIRGD